MTLIFVLLREGLFDSLTFLFVAEAGLLVTSFLAILLGVLNKEKAFSAVAEYGLFYCCPFQKQAFDGPSIKKPCR